MKVLVVAGGTGGHISPGCAMAEELRLRKHDVEFLTLVRNEAYADLKSAAFKVHSYAAPPFPSGIGSLIPYPFKLMSALLDAIIPVRRADIVLGLGGYPTLPALLAAVFFRKKIYLCEQNAVPGQVTRFFARFARHIFATFPISRLSNVSLVGNPVRAKLRSAAAGHEWPSSSKSILILGGSQGARQLNEMVVGLLLDQAWSETYRWFLQCGENNLESVRAKLGERENVTLFGFHSNIQDLYKQAHVLVSRSGAGILTEAMLFGLPMILVPLASSKDGHQLANARICESGGAARVLNQTDSDPAGLANILRELLENEATTAAMALASRKLFHDNAALRIAEAIEAG
ncbi:MAG: UDP-N-acetylglucosamine--N-acetylmuramyl-(pentapeptide) pyrophosphoryl-undecaprenol N-acetylglucosamine transferase [Spirochaetia bacterium]|nr:UDP-N-acetylglucosamine--N-acetylmuramyl-(pentapeptide) pyrophosphoryl-undecaprenol N-acetylglucosamine transferase [Spirochaetia bacterium]